MARHFKTLQSTCLRCRLPLCGLQSRHALRLLLACQGIGRLHVLGTGLAGEAGSKAHAFRVVAVLALAMLVHTRQAAQLGQAFSLLHFCTRLLWRACCRLELHVLGVLAVKATQLLSQLFKGSFWCGRCATSSRLACGGCRGCGGWWLTSATKKPTGKSPNTLSNRAIDNRIHGIVSNSPRRCHRAAHQCTSSSAHTLSATTLPCRLGILACCAQHISGKAGWACVGCALRAKLLARRAVVGLTALYGRNTFCPLPLGVCHLLVNSRLRV